MKFNALAPLERAILVIVSAKAPPFASAPACEEAIPSGRYTGMIKSVDDDRVLQDIGEGRLLSHRIASKRQGDEALVKPGRVATVSYSARAWVIRDPNSLVSGDDRRQRPLRLIPAAPGALLPPFDRSVSDLEVSVVACDRHRPSPECSRELAL